MQSSSDSNESANNPFKSAVTSAIQADKPISSTTTTATILSPILQSSKSSKQSPTIVSRTIYGTPTTTSSYHSKNPTISKLKQSSAYSSPQQTTHGDKPFSQLSSSSSSSSSTHSHSVLLKYLHKTTTPPFNPIIPSSTLPTLSPSLTSLPKIDSSQQNIP